MIPFLIFMIIDLTESLRPLYFGFCEKNKILKHKLELYFSSMYDGC